MQAISVKILIGMLKNPVKIYQVQKKNMLTFEYQTNFSKIQNIDMFKKICKSFIFTISLVFWSNYLRCGGAMINLSCVKLNSPQKVHIKSVFWHFSMLNISILN